MSQHSCIAFVLASLVATSSLGRDEPIGARKYWRPDAALLGTPASSKRRPVPEEFPAVVSLHHRGQTVCTGSMIAPNVILTAKHCLGVSFVTFGANGRSPRLTRRILSFSVAPGGLDLALMRLSEPADVTPLRLREHGESQAPNDISIVGYGHERREHSGFRRVLESSARGWGCSHATEGRFGCSPDYELVLPRSKGADTCRGDSGGPVLEQTSEGWTIVAVTSRGVRGSLLKCGDGGIYVRVDPVRTWIDRQLSVWERAQRPKIEKTPTK